MNQIAQLNTQLQGMSPTDPAAATLMDQRDSAIDQLSQLMDIRVSTNGTNQTTVYTSNGVELVGAQASHAEFQFAGNAERQFAMECQSGPVLGRHDHVQAGERRRRST